MGGHYSLVCLKMSKNYCILFKNMASNFFNQSQFNWLNEGQYDIWTKYDKIDHSVGRSYDELSMVVFCTFCENFP